MFVYRITLARFAGSLKASGRAARWNAEDTEVIYTSSSMALACLENIVHRSQLGLAANFRVLTIEIPDTIRLMTVSPDQLPRQWEAYENIGTTQRIGDRWLKEGKYGVLRVPSSIVPAEVNYLINPRHPEFKKIRLLKSEPFIFDTRIKR